MTMKRYWPVLAIALLTFPVCASMQDRVRPVASASVESFVVPDGTVASIPALPTWAPSRKGPVPVVLVHHLLCNGAPAYGCYISSLPLIQIEDTLPPIRRLYYLRHEVFHLAVYTAGLRFDVPDEENLVAEAMAVQQTTELLAGWLR